MARVRLVLWDATGSRRLHSREGLPAVEVKGGTAAASSAVVNAIRRQLGLDVAFVRIAAKDVVEVERLDSDRALPNGTRWQEWEMSPAVADREVWERPGWLGQVLNFIDAELSQCGLQRTGPPVQHRHCCISAILRIPTNERAVWFKAVPPLFAHEGRLVEWLAGIAPESVPTVIAAGNAWLIATDFPEKHHRPLGDPLEALARIQIASTDRSKELVALGCPQRTLDTLVSSIAALAERSGVVEPEDAESLRSSLRRLDSLCREVTALKVPPTLVHGDLHARNVRWTRAGWLLFDWTDGCVAHPFVDLAAALDDADHDQHTSREAAYGSLWREVAPARDVERALQAAAAIGAAHQAVSFQRIIDGIAPSSQERGQVLRALRTWIQRLGAALRQQRGAGERAGSSRKRCR